MLTIVRLPWSRPVSFVWTSSLTLRLIEKFAEFSGDWEKISNFLNLPIEECRNQMTKIEIQRENERNRPVSKSIEISPDGLEFAIGQALSQAIEISPEKNSIDQNNSLIRSESELISSNSSLNESMENFPLK